MKVGKSMWHCGKCGLDHPIHWTGGLTRSIENDLGVENQYDLESWKRCRCGNTLVFHLEFFECPAGELIEPVHISTVNSDEDAKYIEEVTVPDIELNTYPVN